MNSTQTPLNDATLITRLPTELLTQIDALVTDKKSTRSKQVRRILTEYFNNESAKATAKNGS
ncbi:MAG: hypothetical protein Q7T13_01575 [Polaromonas sp.]|nr:hypothetical protein [Polaromonas sp.]